MVFSSITFLFFFLPIVLAGYHLIFWPVTLGWGGNVWRRVSNAFLLLSSLVFYFWGAGYLVGIILLSTGLDYCAGFLIDRERHRTDAAKTTTPRRRWGIPEVALIMSVTANLSILAYFKYIEFGIESFNHIVQTLDLGHLQTDLFLRTVLPIGISFYTFQSMSYTIDVYRGRVRATPNLLDFACYVTAFPQLVAGPIVRYKEIADDLVGRTVTLDGFALGVQRFILGLCKKVLIANSVATAADAVFATSPEQLTTSAAWLGLVCYTLQIYFDFSGYSDMAIGLGGMFGFRYPENFNYPYAAQSIRDFWHRWHISLSNWFRDYLYIPLGGSQKGHARTYFNLVTVFFLCGLWHGANATFLVWGLYHGLWLVLERVLVGDKAASPRPILSRMYAIAVIMLGWVWFRSPTLSYACSYLLVLSGLFPGAGSHESPLGVDHILTFDVSLGILIGIVFSTPAWKTVFQLPGTAAPAFLDEGRILILRAIGVSALLLLLVACAASLASGTHNPFIYYQF